MKSAFWHTHTNTHTHTHTHVSADAKYLPTLHRGPDHNPEISPHIRPNRSHTPAHTPTHTSSHTLSQPAALVHGGQLSPRQHKTTTLRGSDVIFLHVVQLQYTGTSVLVTMVTEHFPLRGTTGLTEQLLLLLLLVVCREKKGNEKLEAAAICEDRKLVLSNNT